jgi:hypothetical protein
VSALGGEFQLLEASCNLAGVSNNYAWMRVEEVKEREPGSGEWSFCMISKEL